MTTPTNTPGGGCSLDQLVSRRTFELWIHAPPYERPIDRWPMNEERYAWPGQYKDIAVQLAWDAWREKERNYESNKAHKLGSGTEGRKPIRPTGVHDAVSEWPSNRTPAPARR